MFERLVKMNCFSKNMLIKKLARNLLEKLYCCEINCIEIDQSVMFAHHGRGCIIVAAKIYENVVILQNVTIGSNAKYNKSSKNWENIGNPIICENVLVADGAKVFGPITIGENSIIASGAIITKNIPANCIAYGVNEYRAKDENYDFVFNRNILDFHKIIEVNKHLISNFEKNRGVVNK